jgi:hypothetical protein
LQAQYSSFSQCPDIGNSTADKGAGRVPEDTSTGTKVHVQVPPTSGAASLIIANARGGLYQGLSQFRSQQVLVLLVLEYKNRYQRLETI